MMKRPSLAESMKAVERAPAEPPAPEAPRAEPRKPYHAATRAGLKKVTTGLSPAEHKRLKRLAIDQERSVEELLREAVDDLFAKYPAS